MGAGAGKCGRSCRLWPHWLENALQSMPGGTSARADGIHRYVHVATGNYNTMTARIYTDLGFMTQDEAMGKRRFGIV